MSTFNFQDIEPSESISQIDNGFVVRQSSTSTNFLLSSSPNISTALSLHSDKKATLSTVDSDDYLFIKKNDIVLACAAWILGVPNCYFENSNEYRIRHLLGLVYRERNSRDHGHISTKRLILKPMRLKPSASIAPRVTHILVVTQMVVGRRA